MQQPTKKKFRAAALKSGLSSATKRPRDMGQSPRSPVRSAAYLTSPTSNITPRGKRQRKSSTLSVSPAVNETTRKRRRPSILLSLPEELLLEILSFFVSSARVDMNNFINIQLVDKRFNELVNSHSLWKFVPDCLPNGSLNINTMMLIKEKNKGTEGTCFHARRRADGVDVALKRARVYPDNEGVPYYMMRELAALNKISHPNVSSPTLVNLKNSKLYLVLPYVEKTLHDILNPSGDHSSPRAEVIMKKSQVKNIMGQICAAVAYIHGKGILHRNLKPKHLLVIPGGGPDPLDNAQVILSDFALVRVLGHPPKKLTSEVITLWYRPPEILMGQRDYTAAVDLWSVGCIFAELLQGRALFAGLCEIDQLFQIFQTLGTPTETDWPAFKTLPFFQETLFPQWSSYRLSSIVSNANEKEFDFLSKCLIFDPLGRSSALECLQHSYLQDCSESSRFTSQLADKNAFDLTKIDPSVLINVHKTTLRQYSFLRDLESTRVVLPSLNVLQSDSSWQFDVREKMANWVIAITAAYDPQTSCQRTAFFAIALMDTYYAKCLNPDRGKSPAETCSMDLVGACCMHIASKCEDVSYVGIRDLAVSLQNNYEPVEFLLVEEEILNVLQFDLYIPTVIDFLSLFLECIPEFRNQKEISLLCKYLAESTLLSIDFNSFEPSRVATAIASYSLTYNPDGTKNKDTSKSWPPGLAQLSQYKSYDLVSCIQQLQEMQRLAIISAFPNSLFRLYSTAQMCSVSRWLPH